MNLIKRILSVFSLVLALAMHSQEIPPIQVFTPQDYSAEDQNWAITQAPNNFMYVANNAGLLEYNGAIWTLYKSPNNDILRSVKSINDLIYTGGYMDFGFWKKNEFGKLFYTSLVDTNAVEVIEDEEFWGIISIENFVLFQSFERIYIYNISNKSFDIINSEQRIDKMFLVDDSVYFQKLQGGLFKVENGKAEQVINKEQFNDLELVNIYAESNELLLQTKENGFYVYRNNTAQKWQTTTDKLLSNLSVYSSIRLRDGKFVLGTISSGIVLLDKNGDFIQKIDQIDGLSNNTILSITEDLYSNVWLGLDNGIDVINLNSQYKVFKDEQGILGTVYASQVIGDLLYLGTNQGLFYKSTTSINSTFKFVKGTKGQVWTLDFIDGTLFCGHDKGTFIVSENKATKIVSELGAWTLKPIPNRENLLLQGNYNGIHVLEKVNNKWQYRNKLKGFNMSSRFIEFIDNTQVLVNHEYKGVFKLDIDKKLSTVLNYEKLPIKNGVKSSLVKYDDSILYSYSEGVYRFDKASGRFIKDDALSRLFSGEVYVSGRLINEQGKNRLWGFTKDKILYVEPGIASNQPEVGFIEISEGMRKSKTGFENVMPVKDEQYLLGNSQGYLIVDLSKSNSKSYKLNLNKASYTSLHNQLETIDFSQPIDLKNKSNNVHFSYSIPNYSKFLNSSYQYKLLGIYDEWSPWSNNAEVNFENLPHGDYELRVRAKAGAVKAENELSYKFSIAKPWYLKPLAIVFYVILFLLLLTIVQMLNRRFYKRKQQKVLEARERQLEMDQLENQRQIVEFKNKNLQMDIDNKNKELGTATMNLVKRNELLNNIKEELTKSKSLDDVKGVVKLINSSLNSTSDWKLFEEAFNNVDKDFMKHVKSLHPAITSNDLRLCAYLRLNLSSKEIAPLLNISHKSVEVKRYRLRKKMGLDHDQSLVDYILKL